MLASGPLPPNSPKPPLELISPAAAPDPAVAEPAPAE